MKDDIIPDSNHVARYCKGSFVDGDSISGAAFMLREGEDGLSVNWLEYLGTGSQQGLIEILKNQFNSVLSVSKTARIAVLNVGETKSHIKNNSDDERELKFTHQPINGNLSHSEIYNLKHEDELVADLIKMTIKKVYRARN